MFEFTCPKCRTNSAAATLPPVTVSPCRQCGQPLHIIAEAGEAPRGWGSPLLFAVSAVAGLTVSSLIILAWAFFGRGEGDRDDQSRVAQESQSNQAKKPGEETKPGEQKKPGEEKKPPQEDDSLQIAVKPTALTNEQVYQKLLQSCVWIWATDGKEVWTGTGSLVDKEERETWPLDGWVLRRP